MSLKLNEIVPVPQNCSGLLLLLFTDAIHLLGPVLKVQVFIADLQEILNLMTPIFLVTVKRIPLLKLQSDSLKGLVCLKQNVKGNYTCSKRLKSQLS